MAAKFVADRRSAAAAGFGRQFPQPPMTRLAIAEGRRAERAADRFAAAKRRDERRRGLAGATATALLERLPQVAERDYARALRSLSSTSRAAFSSLEKYAEPPKSGFTRFIRRL